MKQAIFLDRDGIINEMYFDIKHGIVESPMHPSQVTLMHGIEELIKGVKNMNFLIVICSNQPAVGLGKMNLKDLNAVNREIAKKLQDKGIRIDYQYYCLHHPYAKNKKYMIECDCRKPKPGLLLKASLEHQIDLSSSWMIGDGVDDIIAGKKAGCKTILVANIRSTENLRIIEDQLGEIKPDFIVKKLTEVLDIIKNR